MSLTKFSPILKQLTISFKDENLLRTAFTHRSYLNEAGKNLASNERLEFLGDAILSFIVSSYLYESYPKHSEGMLTNLRSTIVKTKTLAEVARELKFGEYLFLSRGEEDGGGRLNQSLLADTFEAFLGALYLDQGLSVSQAFLKSVLFAKIPDLLKSELHTDYKSKLQEVVQTFSKNAPTYKVMRTEGPDHAKIFWVSVVVDNTEKETGQGNSKQEAEQNAAAKTLEKMGKL